MRIHAASLLLIAPLALAACQALDVKYVDATLKQVLKREITSRSDRFVIDRPAIPVVRRNTGIVREGAVFCVIVGPDLKQVLRDSADDVRFGVRLMREPRAHLVLERIYGEDGETDLFEGVEKLRFDFPKFAGPSEVGMDRFTPYATTAAAAAGDKLLLDDFELEKRPLPDGIRAAVESLGGPKDRPRYFLSAAGIDFVVTSQDPTTLLMLDFLISEGRTFEGGVKVRGRIGKGNENVTVVDVRWLQLGGGLYFRSSAPAAPEMAVAS